MAFENFQPIHQVVLYDGYGNPYAVRNGEYIPINTPSDIGAGQDEYGRLQRFTMVEDESTPDLWRLAITGKVSIQIAPPPAGGVPITIFADNPLAVSQAISPHRTSTIIPSGKTLFIQQIIAGCQGDPTANGSKVEVYFNNGTDHLVDRIYIMGETQFGNYPDTSQARDGTLLVGNGTNYIAIDRSRLSNSLQEIDSVIRGYTI